MSVICPACDARFRDPPADIPKTRPLQCSKCEHEWVPALISKPRIELNAPSMAPDMRDLLDGGEAIQTRLPVVMPGIAKSEEANLRSNPIYVDKEPEIKPKRSFAFLIPTVSLACLAFIATSITTKGTIMRHAPQTVALYQAAGLASANPGLEITNVVTTKSTRDGIAQLIVKGEVANVAYNTVPVPPIKLIMRGQSNASLYAWTVSAAKGELKAGEKSRFTAVAHDFPEQAVNVEVEFATRLKEKQTTE